MIKDVELTKYQKEILKKLDDNRDSVICKVKGKDDEKSKTWIQYRNGRKEIIRSNTINILIWKGYIREQRIKVPHLTYNRTEKKVV